MGWLGDTVDTSTGVLNPRAEIANDGIFHRGCTRPKIHKIRLSGGGGFGQVEKVLEFCCECEQSRVIER